MLFSIVCKFLKGSVKKIQVNLEEAAAILDKLESTRACSLAVRAGDPIQCFALDVDSATGQRVNRHDVWRPKRTIIISIPVNSLARE